MPKDAVLTHFSGAPNSPLGNDHHSTDKGTLYTKNRAWVATASWLVWEKGRNRGASFTKRTEHLTKGIDFRRMRFFWSIRFYCLGLFGWCWTVIHPIQRLDGDAALRRSNIL